MLKAGLTISTPQACSVQYLNAFEGILDETHNAGYTTDVAYSLRKLRAEYEGSAIRVRRSQDDAEIDVGFDSSGLLDTAAIATHCADKNGFVSKWYDQSGNSRDVAQATSTKQPAIYEEGVHVKDSESRSFVKFDDTDDVLALTDEIATTEAFKQFMVVDPTSAGRIYDSNGDNDNLLIQSYRYIFRINTVNAIVNATTGFDYNIIDLGRDSNGTRNLFVNGTDILAGWGSTSGENGLTEIGSKGSPYGGAIYEFIRFSGDTKMANINAATIRTALNTYYEVF